MRSSIWKILSIGVLVSSASLSLSPLVAQEKPVPKAPSAKQDVETPVEAAESADIEVPPSSVDPALLKELLERLAKVEGELRKLKSEKSQNAKNGNADEKPSIYALLETPYIGSTDYDPSNSARFFAVKVVYINLGVDPIVIHREEIELDVDGTVHKIGEIVPAMQYHSFQANNQQFQLQNLKTPDKWTVPPGGTTSTWMLFTDLPQGSNIPPMELKTRFGENVFEVDVNQFALGALQLTVERIGPQNSLAFLTIAGALDTVNVGSLVGELDRLAANRVVRAVIAFDESAPAIDNQLFNWLQYSVVQAGRSNNNVDPRFPSLPMSMREIHLCQLPADSRGMVDQYQADPQTRIHETANQAVNAALRSAYEVLPRDELIREIDAGHPLTRSAALANGGGRLSSKELPMILKYADDNELHMQTAALAALRHFGEPEAIEKLLQYVRKNAEPLSFVAIDSLADSRFAAAHQALLEVLKAEPPTSKKTIVEVLADHPRPIWSETIFEFASDPPAEYTAAALLALTRIGHPQLYDVLKDKLEKGNSELQEVVLGILIEKGDAESEKLAIDYTLNSLEKAPPTAQMFALLHRTKDPRALPLLIKQFDQIPEQRSSMIGIIAKIADDQAIDFLVKRYPDLPPHDQASILNALRQGQSSHFIKLAGEALNSTDASLVSTACQGLQTDASPEAVKLLIEAFKKSPNNNTWSYTADALANLAPPEASAVLKEVRRSTADKSKRQIAHQALRRIDQRSPGYQYIYQAQQQVREEKWDEALTFYDLALKLDPQLADAFAGRGHVRLQQEKQDEALADFQKAMEIDDYNSQAVTGVSVILVQQGKIEEGIKTIENDREKFDGDALYAYNSACVYGRAIEYLKKQEADDERDAKIGEFERIALQQLRTSLEQGFGDLDWMKKDPDLNSLHELPEFEKIASGMSLEQ
ncbi:MAG: hypothetical protein O2955_06870 [Planctomycetota bacterium]|nr:hypothetical protein [Planctomycetota bacterium]MDA1212218.1 hypothetical protein [Planctomycetota bacterium]